MLLNQEQSEVVWKFIKNHKDEIHPLVYSFCAKAKRNLDYYHLDDGKDEEGYDKSYYCYILGVTAWSFVEPDPNSDWYLHPEDFPDFYERMLFN